MSGHIYENRQIELWHEYEALDGRVSFDAFMGRHLKSNEWIVNLMREHGRLSAEIDRPKDYEKEYHFD